MASGSGWNVWVWLAGSVASRCGYIDFLMLLISTPVVSVFFCSSITTFCSFKNMFFIHLRICFSFLFQYIFVIYFLRSINKHKGDYGRPTEAI